MNAGTENNKPTIKFVLIDSISWRCASSLSLKSVLLFAIFASYPRLWTILIKSSSDNFFSSNTTYGYFNITNTTSSIFILNNSGVYINENVTLGNNSSNTVTFFDSPPTFAPTCGSAYNHSIVSNASGNYICASNGSQWVQLSY